MMKKFAEIAPAIGIIAAGTAVAISFYAGQATAQHNDKPKAHPILTQLIRDNAAKIVLLKQSPVLTPAQNVQANKNFADNQARILLALDRLHVKFDMEIANR